MKLFPRLHLNRWSSGVIFLHKLYIYIVVQEVSTSDIIYIAFPNGGDWVAETVDPFLDELDKEFKNLEDYLKNNPSEEIKRNY